MPVPPPPPDSAVMGGAGAGADESESSRLRLILVERLRSLEASYVKLREQFNLVLEEKSSNRYSNEDTCDTGSYCGPGVFYTGNPYRNVLEDLGHALYVTNIDTGEIIYW